MMVRSNIVPVRSWTMRVLVVGLAAALSVAWAGAEVSASPETAGSLEPVLEAYEELRAELAADRLEGLPATAERLADAFRAPLEDRDELAEPVATAFEEGAAAAESLAQAEDLEAARIAFGEVSRNLLTLTGQDGQGVEGWHVFACPMAQGFERWIQPMEEMANPYMGPSMLECGVEVDWAVPEPRLAEAHVPVQETSESEPEFKPGIAGLRMEDVRDHKFLWREIDELQIWERGDRITVAEFRTKMIEKTTHFLELDGATADEFATAVTQAMANLRSSLQASRQGRTFDYYGDGWTDGEDTVAADLRAAADLVASVLGDAPRHQLFVPHTEKWLLKLTLGPSRAKEAKEAQQARAELGESSSR